MFDDYNNNQLFMEVIFEITTPSHIVYAMYHKDDDITEDIVIKKNRAGKHGHRDRSNMIKDKAKHGHGHLPCKWNSNKAYNQQSLTNARNRAMKKDNIFDDITMKEAIEYAEMEAEAWRLHDAEEEAKRLLDNLYNEATAYSFHMEAIESLKVAMSRDEARLKELNDIIRSIKG